MPTDGLLDAAADLVDGGDLDPFPEGLAPLGEPVGVGLSGSSGTRVMVAVTAAQRHLAGHLTLTVAT
jgi:hypothetical protein